MGKKTDNNQSNKEKAIASALNAIQKQFDRDQL